MINFWFWKKRRWFSLLLISYLSILFISIITGALVYNNVINTVKLQSASINNIIVNQVKQEIDLHFKEIKDLIYHLSMNIRVNQFSRAVYPLDTNQRYEVQNIIDVFAGLIDNNNVIDDFAVFFPSSQVVITSSAYYRTRDFFDHIYGSSEISYNDWIDTISSYSFGGFANFKMLKKDFTSTTVLPYIQSVNSGVGDVPAANVMVFVDESKILSVIKELEAAYVGNCIYVLDDYRILFSDYRINIDHNVLMGLSDKKPFYYNVNNENVMISYLPSEYLNWRYYTVSSMDYVMKNVNNIRFIVLFAGVLYLLFGLAIVFFMAYKSYNPVRRIIDLISSSFKGEKGINTANEMLFIQNTLESIVNKEQERTEKLNNQWLMLKNSILDRLVKGNIEDQSMINESMDICQICFPYNKICVSICFFDVRGAVKPGVNLKSIEGLIASMKEAWNENFRFNSYSFLLDDITIAIITNFEASVSLEGAGCHDNIQENIQENMQENIYCMLKEVKDSMYKLYSYPATICIGGIHSGIDGIKLSYKEAVAASDYRMIYGNNSLICYDKLTCQDGNYYYPMEVEVKLISCVKTGDFKEADTILKQLFDENFKVRRLPIKLIQCLYYDMMSTAIKTLENINIEYQAVFYEASGSVERLVQCQTVEEIYIVIRDIYQRICSHIDKNKKSHNLTLKMKIEEYIHRNFMNPDFSQTQVAEALNISPNYLSSLFKEQFGEKMIDYISKLRMQKAMEFLADENLTVAEAAVKVGCLDDMALTRLFKRYLNTTPGTYRGHLKNK